MPTLSLAMMCKNESVTMAKVLDNIVDVVDEIVICVDDTSDDATWDTAYRYADKLYKYTWRDDFAWARNNVISKCTSDWVLVLDGHDFMVKDSASKLRGILDTTPPNIDVISGWIYLNCDEDGVPEIFFPQVRMIRRGESWFEQAVHNHINTPKDRQQFYADLVVKHIPTAERSEARRQQRRIMNVRVLKEKIKDEPGNLRSYIYLGNTYADYADDYPEYVNKARGCYLGYLKAARGSGGRDTFINSERYEVCTGLAKIAMYQGKKDDAIKYALSAIENSFERREAYCMLGDIAVMGKFWKEATFWYNTALLLPTPLSPTFLHGPSYSYGPHWELCVIYAEQGELETALIHAKQCLKYKPNDKRFLDSVKRLEESMQPLHTETLAEEPVII